MSDKQYFHTTSLNGEIYYEFQLGVQIITTDFIIISYE